MDILMRTPFRQVRRLYGSILSIDRSLTAVGENSNLEKAKGEEIEARLKRTELQLAELQQLVTLRTETLEARLNGVFRERLYVPPIPQANESDSFMQYSTCTISDMFHPKYAEILRKIGHPPIYHRKLWEWVFVIHHLTESGMLTNGNRGLGFGIGKECLPALFASLGCEVVATDAPPEIGIESGWSVTGQHAGALDDLRYPSIVSDATFDKLVSLRYCDMNSIDPQLTGFDFTWSSCCFEHLGTLEKGLDFVVNSLDTLRPGGIAVHTTEFNLSSNDETVADGPTVLYRKQDMERLIDRLRALGHEVQPFSPAPYSHPLDFYVDAPPYVDHPHLKLRIGQYAATSVGLVIRKTS